MPRTRHPTTVSPRQTGAVNGAWWFARWLLVLVLAFDHLSAPFHHHHDGSLAQLDYATAHVSFDEAEMQAVGDEHRFVSHSAMAIRAGSSRLGQLPAAAMADLPVAFASMVEWRVVPDESAPADSRRDRPRPDFRSHRSLPPAGRAPPLHA